MFYIKSVLIWQFYYIDSWSLLSQACKQLKPSLYPVMKPTVILVFSLIFILRQLCPTAVPVFWEPVVSWFCTLPGSTSAVRVLCFHLQPRLFFISVPDSCLTWLLKVIICQKQVIRLTACESYVGKVTAYLACREFQSWCAGRNTFFIAPPTNLLEHFAQA